MSLKPIKKKRLFEEIIVAIEKYIREEKIQPGERLPSENELAALFNVSKTAVREAMSVLNANGVIETRSGAGIFLKDTIEETVSQRLVTSLIKKSELQEILEFRRGLEIEAAALAAMRATPQDIKRIVHNHEVLIEANKAGEFGIKEDYMFHYSIIIASHNNVYRNVFKAVSYKVEKGIRVSKMQSISLPNRFAQAYEEHEEIIEAISLRNPEQASAAMRAHLTKNEEKIWTYFKENEPTEENEV
ncbi:FadR/GntR family transcriptional regulator [Aneurinibacillus tyrosinisolvens]|uniref:FadR/GntR family transcriptional regulator n=1 Tax=Aneurinibacillus tyrosinisolvens TaxID=1443435 RepID=UPI00063F29DA|nr:FCD domain-containing protein [Aneurinibacillus tyrosinisolvens]